MVIFPLAPDQTILIASTSINRTVNVYLPNAVETKGIYVAVVMHLLANSNDKWQ